MNQVKEAFLSNTTLLVFKMNYINHSIKRSYIPSPSRMIVLQNELRWKVQELMIAVKIVMEDARINGCSHGS